MVTREKIQKLYLDFLLTEGEPPKSVYVFAKKNKMTEADFYTHFGSFEGIEAAVWQDLTENTLREISAQEVWNGYSAREKTLSFFYSYVELLKNHRSFVVYTLAHLPKTLRTPAVFEPAKQLFTGFSEGIVAEGLESGELAKRGFLSHRYKDALWGQFIFLLNFWVKDQSAGFERTDEAIEKGINLTFDLFERSPIDSIIDYGKFLVRTR